MKEVAPSRMAARIVVASIVSNAALFGGAVMTSRQLGPSGRGTLVLIITVASLVAITMSLGTSLAARVHLVDPDDPLDLHDHLGLALLLTLLAGALTAGVATVALPIAGVHLTAGAIAGMAVYSTVYLAAVFLLEILNAYGLSDRAAVLDAIGSLVALGAIGILIAANSTRPSSYVAIITLGFLLQGMLTLLVIARSRPLPRPRLSIKSSQRLLRTGVPGLAWSLGATFTFRLDRYLTGVYLDPAAVGLYSVAATATELLRLVPTAVGRVYFHRLAARISDLSHLARARRTAIALTITGALALLAFAPLVVPAALGDSFEPSVTPLRILLLGEISVAAFFIDTSALAALGATGRAGAASLIGFATVVLLDVILIPTFGISGAAWASVIAYWTMAVSARLWLRSRYGSTSTAQTPTRADRS